MKFKNRTMGGYEYRIICTDRVHPTHPLVALVKVNACDGISEYTVCYTKEGRYRTNEIESKFDLVLETEQEIQP
jgi:hypothetical protein